MSRRRTPSGSSGDDDETSIYEADTRPKKDTKRGHDKVPEAQQAIRVISMKTPGVSPNAAQAEAKAHAVKLRALSEVSGPSIQIPLGNLAPPRDPKEAVKRRARDYLIIGLAIAIVGSLVMLGVMIVAGR